VTGRSNNPGIATAIRSTFGNKRLLVIGDLMLDQYVWGDISRISPEAPVPVLRHDRDARRAGGAGNVALNIAGLGVNIGICGYVGRDQFGDHLTALLRDGGVDVAGLVRLEDRPTITKTRIIARQQQVLRMDAEDLSPMAEQSVAALLQAIERELAADVDGIILSDYAKGVLAGNACQTIIGLARRHKIPVFVDPKGADFSRYRGANVITPNLAELAHATGVAAENIEQLIEAGRAIVRDIGLDYMVLTRGADGATIITPDSTLHSAAVAREVFDVSGAGDTFIATVAAGHVAGLAPSEMLHLANIASGIAVSKVGTVAVDKAAVLEALDAGTHAVQDSLFGLDELQRQMGRWREQGEQVVFTNGCFDILHAGHVTYLQKAALLGDRLVVGLNTDRSVGELKGTGRPIVPEADRAKVVGALAAVDAVVLFDENTPLNLIRALRPDVLVKGGDYSKDRIVGAAEVDGWGGRVQIIPLVAGRSTSQLIEKITG